MGQTSVRLGVLAAVVFFGACTSSSNTTPTAGNAELGISEFRITETKELTTVVGVDAGREIARLELVHGRAQPARGLRPRARRSDDRRTQAVGHDRQRELPVGDARLHRHDADAEAAARAGSPSRRSSRTRTCGRCSRSGRSWWAGAGPSEAGPSEVAYDNAGDSSRTGVNPSMCNGWGATNMMCPIQSGSTHGNTNACNNAASWMAEAVDNFTSNGDAWTGSTVFMCCGAQVSGPGYAVKTCAATAGVSVASSAAGPGVTPCPAGHFCSACGDGGTNKCIACGSPVAYSNYCTLWTQPWGGGKTEVVHSYDDGVCLASTADCSTGGNCCYGNVCETPECTAKIGDPGSLSGADCCNGSCKNVSVEGDGGTCATIGTERFPSATVAATAPRAAPRTPVPSRGPAVRTRRARSAAPAATAAATTACLAIAPSRRRAPPTAAPARARPAAAARTATARASARPCATGTVPCVRRQVSAAAATATADTARAAGRTVIPAPTVPSAVVATATAGPVRARRRRATDATTAAQLTATAARGIRASAAGARRSTRKPNGRRLRASSGGDDIQCEPEDRAAAPRRPECWTRRWSGLERLRLSFVSREPRLQRAIFERDSIDKTIRGPYSHSTTR